MNAEPAHIFQPNLATQTDASGRTSARHGAPAGSSSGPGVPRRRTAPPPPKSPVGVATKITATKRAETRQRARAAPAHHQSSALLHP